MSPKKEEKAKETVTDDIDLENDDEIELTDEVKEEKKDDKKDDQPETKNEVKEESRAETKKEVKEEAKKEVKKEEETTKEEVKEKVKESAKDSESKPAPPKKDSIGLTVYNPEPITKDTPPPKPKRPLTPRQESFKTLKDAFPTFEDKLIQTVLIASGFRLEPSFNALLYYTDPSNVNIEEVAVETPEVLQKEAVQHSRTDDLLKQDELLAKQLDEEFKRKERRRLQRQQQQQYDQHSQRRQGTNQHDNLYNDDDEEDVFTNLIEKDLPQLKEQFNKNLQETKTKFSNWFNNLSRPAEQPEFRQSDFQPQEFQTHKYGRTNKAFDDEPEVLDMSKFQGIKLDSAEDDEENKPSLPNRNRSSSVDLYGAPKSSSPAVSGTTATKKSWEPISGAKTTTSVQDDDDDFLLSEDEGAAKK